MNRLSKTILLTSTFMLGAIVAGQNVQATQYELANEDSQQVVETIKDQSYMVHTDEAATSAETSSNTLDKAVDTPSDVEVVTQTEVSAESQTQSGSHNDVTLQLSENTQQQTVTVTINGVASETTESVVVTVWTKEDRSDAQTLVATKTEQGTYTATIERTQLNEATTQFFVAALGEQSSFSWNITEDETTESTSTEESTATKEEAQTVASVDNDQKDLNKPSFNPGKPSATVNIENINKRNGSFDVVISNIYAPKGLKELLVPVWSDANDQNDLKWYTAQRQVNGTYKVAVSLANHQFETGLYKAHAYMKQLDGSQTGVGSTSAVIEPIAKQGKMYMKQSSAGEGMMEVVVVDAYDWRGVEKILVPVWASDKGQDDLVWYTASRQEDGTFRVAISAAHHLNQTGEYNVHMYYKMSDGKNHFVAENKVGMTVTQANRQKAKASVSIVDLEDGKGSFEVHVKDLYAPNGIKSVLIPVWTEMNGQNDLVWYTANREEDGTYKVASTLSKHHNEVGLLNAHVYIKQQNNQQVFAGGTNESIGVKPASGKVKIVNQDNMYGRFDVLVSGVENGFGVKEVLVPVWAEESGQDDLIWYNAKKQSNGTYIVSVDSRKHRSQLGAYQAHVYYVQSDGSRVAVTGTSTVLERTVEPEAGIVPFEQKETIIRKLKSFRDNPTIWKAVYERHYGSHPTTYEELHALSSAEKQVLATIKPTFSAIYDNYNDEEIATIEELWDMNVVRSTFLNLVNAERSRLGLQPLVYSNKLNEKATIRATEQADYGSSVYYKNVNTSSEQRMAHTRPDGSSWTTVFTPEESRRANGAGEITLDQAGNLPLAFLLDEQAVAKKHFEMWKGSKGHYDILTGRHMRYIGYDIAIDHYLKNRAWDVLVGAAILSNGRID